MSRIATSARPLGRNRAAPAARPATTSSENAEVPSGRRSDGESRSIIRPPTNAHPTAAPSPKIAATTTTTTKTRSGLTPATMRWGATLDSSNASTTAPTAARGRLIQSIPHRGAPRRAVRRLGTPPGTAHSLGRARVYPTVPPRPPEGHGTTRPATARARSVPRVARGTSAARRFGGQALRPAAEARGASVQSPCSLREVPAAMIWRGPGTTAGGGSGRVLLLESESVTAHRSDF